MGTHPLHSIYLCGLTLTHLNTYFLFGLELTFFAKYYLENWGVQLIGVGELGVGIDSASYQYCHLQRPHKLVSGHGPHKYRNTGLRVCMYVCI